MRRGLAFVGWLVLVVVFALPLAMFVGWHWFAAGREARRSERLQQRKDKQP